MSKSWTRQRARLFAAEESTDTPSGRISRSADRNTDTVGRDFARLRSRGRRASGPWLAITLSALVAALMVASLRVSILRLRYQLSDAISEETNLLERQRTVTVVLRELRDPTRLHDLATKWGFARPERVIQLSVPAASMGGNAP